MSLSTYRYTLTKGVQKVKTRTALVLTATALAVGGGGGLSLAIFGTTHADTLSNINFESPAYTTGNINGQQGWSKTGPYDAEVVNNTAYGFSGLGSQSLRISNAVTSGAFGDQTFSPALSQPAGEANAFDKDGNPVAAPQPHFEAQFDVASTTKADQGMATSVSPDNGSGARMSYVRLEDQADGIHVFFDDATDPSHVVNADQFNEYDIATLSYGSVHTVKFAMDFKNGPDNDVVKVYLDGHLAKVGTSWEDYYLYDTESNPTSNTNSRAVTSLLFREGGAVNAVPANAGKGYLFDNVSLMSGPTPVTTNVPTSKDQCMNNGWKSFGTTFKNQGDCVSFVASKGKNQPTNPPAPQVLGRTATGNLTLSPAQTLNFNVSDTGPSLGDVGTVSYANNDPNALGLHYTVPTTCVNVFGNTAYFAYQIPANAPVAANVWVIWKVVDNGTSDSAGFTVAADQASANAACESGTAPVNNYAILTGDVVVL